MYFHCRARSKSPKSRDSDRNRRRSRSASRSSSSSSSRSSSSGSSSGSSSSDSRSRSRSVSRGRRTPLKGDDKKALPQRSRSRDRKSISRSKSPASRSPRSRSGSPRRRRSASPAKITKIHVGKLTRNVTQEHVQEIFSTYGKIKTCELPMDRNNLNLSRGFAYVDFESHEDAEKAIKYMDGGQIDGQEVNVSLVLVPRGHQFPGFGSRRPPRRRSPPRFGRQRRSPPRYRKSPDRRSRSRSPRRRRRSSSGSSR